ncbi:MAG: amidohydrolase family protein [Actinomycetota bacterium]|nr:amidohydrolase family protein [Actinomycetota bacterium]
MTLVLRDVTVVDLPARRTVRGCSVHIEGERITKVTGPGAGGGVAGTGAAGTGAAGTGAGAGAGDGAQVDVVDCGGRYLLPGLTDVHVHLRAAPHEGPHSDARRPAGHSVPSVDDLLPVLHGYLFCGVTSLFDAGNFGTLMWPLREEERSGRMLSPRIHCAGPFVTCTGGHGSELAESVPVDTLPGDEPQLRAHLGHRPDLVKITYDEHNWGIRPLIAILPPEVLGGIIEIVHEAGLRVTVHVSNELRAREAVDRGADALAHPVIQSPVTEDFAARLALQQVPIASTLAIGERYVRLADHPDFVDSAMYVHCLSSAERERLRTLEHETQRTNRWADWMRVMTPVAQENVRRVVEAGGIVASGSDLSLGPDLLHELELLQDAGIDPWDVLASATASAARYLGVEEHLGTVEAGKLADLVLVDQDPTTDVSRLTKISMVVKGGQIVDPSSLLLAGEPPMRSAAPGRPSASNVAT